MKFLPYGNDEIEGLREKAEELVRIGRKDNDHWTSEVVLCLIARIDSLRKGMADGLNERRYLEEQVDRLQDRAR